MFQAAKLLLGLAGILGGVSGMVAVAAARVQEGRLVRGGCCGRPWETVLAYDAQQGGAQLVCASCGRRVWVNH